jgi:hypothetical protein
VEAWLERNELAAASTELAEIIQDIDTLPDRDREAGWVDLLQFCIKVRDWDQAIATLTKLAAMANPPSGRQLVRLWGQRLCEAAGRRGVLSETHLAELRKVLTHLCPAQTAAG